MMKKKVPRGPAGQPLALLLNGQLAITLYPGQGLTGPSGHEAIKVSIDTEVLLGKHVLHRPISEERIAVGQSGLRVYEVRQIVRVEPLAAVPPDCRVEECLEVKSWKGLPAGLRVEFGQ